MTKLGKDYHCQICNAVTPRNVVYVVSGYPICKCENCGVGRVDISSFNPHEYYDNGYFTGKYEHSYTDYIGSKDAISREFARTLAFIRSMGPSEGSLIEIGCAYGLFLQQARQYYNVHGVELVQEAVAYCHSHGLTSVKHGTLTKNDLEKIGSLDVAVMLDVIEHIDNICETIEMIAMHLRPGGSLVITTGDWSSLVARLAGPKWRLMAPPLHLWYFTPHGLQKMGQQFGLELVSCSHPWKIVPLDLILHQAQIMMGVSPVISLPNYTKGLGLPANLFDTMRLVFRKAI